MLDRLRYSRPYLALALGIIFGANFINYVDRQLVSALGVSISDEFHLSETEYNSLWTLFTLGYMLCALPLGALADRNSRPRVFAGCIVLWSLATIATGWTHSTAILYIARVLTGVGEAGCLVVGPSLLSDYFSERVRGKALSVFYLGMPLGGTAAFIFAGLFDPSDWRNLFYLAGFPGFALAVAIALLRDPPRGQTKNAAHAHVPAHKALMLLKNHTLRWVILAQTCAVIVLIPLVHNGVKYFVEDRGIEQDNASRTMGLIALVSGVLGNLASGTLGDWLSRRRKGAYAFLASIGYALAFPCLLSGFLLSSQMLLELSIGLGCFFLFFCMPAVNTQIANAVPATQRATAWALAVFILHLLGDMLSPLGFGALVDLGLKRQTVFILFSASLLGASFFAFLASRTAARDEAAAAAPSNP